MTSSIGDMELLVDQTIAFATDEIYFNMIAEGPVDLSIPMRVAAKFLEDAAARAEATEFLQSGRQDAHDPLHRPHGHDTAGHVWGTT